MHMIEVAKIGKPNFFDSKWIVPCGISQIGKWRKNEKLPTDCKKIKILGKLNADIKRSSSNYVK